jgi:hypothetical protein
MILAVKTRRLALAESLRRVRDEKIALFGIGVVF